MFSRCVAALVLVVVAVGNLAAGAAEYAVVVSQATSADADWNQVVQTLVKKHHASVITYADSVSQSLPELKRQFPRYACFVAKPTEATREFVAQVQRVTRKLDDDPYTDVLWGILTGYDAANARKIAAQTEPLVIKNVLGGTEIALDRCVAGTCFSELKAGERVRKTANGESKMDKGPADSTKAIADGLTQEPTDLFVTSGHATERDWQIGFAYRNGQFVSKGGQLFGVNVAGEKFAIQSDHPRVYLAVGNCLMGHVDGPDAMALAFLNSAGIRQMVGYTVPTWYGYAGWGCLDYFVEQPGRFTLSEAFFANEQALIQRLAEYAPELLRAEPAPGSTSRQIKLSAQAKSAGLTTQDLAGLLHDRDVVAFYGDPAWEARMATGTLNWEQTLTQQHGTYELRITPKAGEKSFQPVNTNGSQRGGRPIIQFLPHRVQNVHVTGGAELNPVITDNFILVPLPTKAEPQREFRITFTAEKE